jgi:ADP-ribose pyrophosphatase YjhB (NUDIX family)
MTATGPNPQPGGTPRTDLERRIRDRRMTLEEFVRYAEVFAMANHENGTISLRHLQRLISGRAPATRLRPATARLLERIFKEDIRTLLAPECAMVTDGAHSLRVAIAIVTWDTRVLLVARRGEPGQIWQFPAGMVKPGAQADAVAVAETLAETGAARPPAASAPGSTPGPGSTATTTPAATSPVRPATLTRPRTPASSGPSGTPSLSSSPASESTDPYLPNSSSHHPDYRSAIVAR